MLFFSFNFYLYRDIRFISDMKKTNKSLCKLRALTKLTLREFSKTAGIDFGYYCLLEQGVRKLTKEHIDKISIATGVDRNCLIESKSDLKDFMGRAFTHESFQKWNQTMLGLINQTINGSLNLKSKKNGSPLNLPLPSTTISELIKIIIGESQKNNKAYLAIYLITKELKKLSDDLGITEEVNKEAKRKKLKFSKAFPIGYDTRNLDLGLNLVLEDAYLSDDMFLVELPQKDYQRFS